MPAPVQDCNATGTHLSRLHFVPEEQSTEAHSLNCYIQVKSSLIQLHLYPYHNTSGIAIDFSGAMTFFDSAFA